MNYARKMKAKMITGQEMIRAWAITCDPVLHVGAGSERYKIMCNSLKGAVEPFSKQTDFNVFELCNHVLTIFHDVVTP